MAIERHVDTFEMTSRTDRSRYETLLNTPGVHVEKVSDFFGVVQGGPDEEGFTTITRVVDYIKTAASPIDQACERAYQQPVV